MVQSELDQLRMAKPRPAPRGGRDRAGSAAGYGAHGRWISQTPNAGGCDRRAAVQVGLNDGALEVAGMFVLTRCPGRSTSWPGGLLSLPPEPKGPEGFLLAWTAALSFCSGLFGLAVLPLFHLEAPRWLILAYGVSCALQALLALLLSRPRRRPGRRKGVDAASDGAATWQGPWPAPARS